MKFEHLRFETCERRFLKPVERRGQSAGVVPVGVLVTHIPTGLFAFCDVHRSQMKNRNTAMAMIEYGLADIETV